MRYIWWFIYCIHSIPQVPLLLGPRHLDQKTHYSFNSSAGSQPERCRQSREDNEKLFCGKNRGCEGSKATKPSKIRMGVGGYRPLVCTCLQLRGEGASWLQQTNKMVQVKITLRPCGHTLQTRGDGKRQRAFFLGSVDDPQTAATNIATEQRSIKKVA